MENQGWIKLHRKLKDTSFKRNPLVVALFVHLLLSVNQEKRKFYRNGQEIEVLPGQLLTGRNELSKQTGISHQSIRTCLTVLKSTSTITIQSTNRFSLISILNWQEYQSHQPAEQPANQQTTNQQLTTNKNTKNIYTSNTQKKKEEEIYIYKEEEKKVSKNVKPLNKYPPLIEQKLGYADCYRIAGKLSIKIEDVIRKYFYIREKIETDTFRDKNGKVYPHKDLNLVLQAWLRRDKEEGKVRTMTEFDLMVFDRYAPGMPSANAMVASVIKWSNAQKKQYERTNGQTT